MVVVDNKLLSLETLSLSVSLKDVFGGNIDKVEVYPVLKRNGRPFVCEDDFIILQGV